MIVVLKLILQFTWIIKLLLRFFLLIREHVRKEKLIRLNLSLLLKLFNKIEKSFNFKINYVILIWI